MATYEGWAIVELMGHRVEGGHIAEVEMFGGRLLRLDVYDGDGETPARTHFYTTSAIYCITPTDENAARHFRRGTRVEVLQPALPAPDEVAWHDPEEAILD